MEINFRKMDISSFPLPSSLLSPFSPLNSVGLLQFYSKFSTPFDESMGPTMNTNGSLLLTPIEPPAMGSEGKLISAHSLLEPLPTLSIYTFLRPYSTDIDSVNRNQRIKKSKSTAKSNVRNETSSQSCNQLCGSQIFHLDEPKLETEEEWIQYAELLLKITDTPARRTKLPIEYT